MKNNICGIYSITRKSTGQIYIGQSIDIKRRFEEHKRGMHAPVSKIDNAMLKYDEDDFELKIIKCCKPRYLNRFEKLYIKIYNAFEDDFHYNMTVGGDGLGSGEDHPNFGTKHTEEHKRKINASMSGPNNPNYGKIRSKEHSEKISRALKGKMAGSKNPMYGRRGENSPILGRKHTEEERAKISKTRIEKGLSKGKNNPMSRPEVRKKVSIKNSGENNPFYGKKHTEESLKKMSENNARYWLGKHLSEEHKRKIGDAQKGRKESIEKVIEMSKISSSTGFFHVSKQNAKGVDQGFIYRYTFYDDEDNKKQISSVDIEKLEKLVKDKGLLWLVVDEEKAKKTLEFNKKQKQKPKKQKYKFWETSKVQYRKSEMFRNNEDGLLPRSCFVAKFNGKKIAIGTFKEFVSPSIIHDLIITFNNKKNWD
ncbi:NUMOD3 domain-containing DNA-binding protein [Methanobrevibacter sp.]|uniref:NUMOD3 domain-containing DNA-binding protein n=1 Tax=Methanobrevibacter sp. TaxID=66852 RepID=UPI0025DA93DD|nr:NUMOD3 domain-containing DNA-binding protein [Methanobrevibacter sp.]MBQ2962734.1 GIY-YIG nuclease family protein [Methanobrevibacter sp.]